MADLTAMSEEELNKLFEDVKREISRRVVLDTAPDRQNQLNQEVLSAEGIKFGDSWRAPQGAHNAYSKNWEVSHNNKRWVSLISGNAAEPGISGWREVVSEGDVPTWYQPAGGHDAYSYGDKVKHNGKVYLNNHPGTRTNVWEPGKFAGWVEQE